MKFICKYKRSKSVTFTINVISVTQQGFSGTYTTTHGKDKEIKYNSGDSCGFWHWCEVDCIKIKDALPIDNS